MPPRRDKGRKSDGDDSADESGDKLMTMTEQQLEAIMSNIAKSQMETSRLLIESIITSHREAQSGGSTPTPAAFKQGNFSKCTARFDGTTATGTSDDADVLEAFIDAVQTYKECANVSDEHALRGLPMLLTGSAAVWWRGVKSTTTTWDDALKRLRGMYGVPRPAYKIFREVFSQVHNSERADVFVSRIIASLSRLPYVLTEIVKLDIVYGLLDRRIRKRVPREAVESVEQLIEKARFVEESLAEVSTNTQPNPTSANTKPKSPNPANANSKSPNPANANAKSPNPANACMNTNDHKVNPSTAEVTEKASDNSRFKRVRPRCGFCKLFGHTTDVCRRVVNRADGRSADKPETELRCYKCDQPGTTYSRCERCKSAATSKMEFHSLQIDDVDGARPVVTVEIANHKGTAILDTGATHSIASPGLHKLLVQEGVKFTETHRAVRLADGTQQVRPALTCDTSVNLGTRCIPVSFIVFPDADTRTLLGRDFIVQANLVLDLSKGTWCFSDKPQEVHPFTKLSDLQPAGGAELMKVDTSQLTLRDEEGTRLTADQKVQLNALLVRKADRFATEGPPTNYAEHHIKVSEKQEPIASPPYRLSQGKRMILEQELKKLLDADIIEECESPWVANVVLVAKKDGGVRLCVDYRKLNAVTEPDRYPLPRIEDILHAAKTSTMMTTCDLRSGYFQVGVTPSHRDMTAFVTPIGTFRFKRMPMGLRNSGATFQRLVDRFKTGKSLTGITILAYLDDLIILSDSFEKHLQDLESVFDRLCMFNLRINREKSHFARDSVKFLGHLIVPGGIQADPEKTRAISEMPAPQNVKHLKTFLQTSSWFRRYIPNYAQVAKPLTDLLKKDATWTWSSIQQEAFEEIKGLLISAPILRQADETKPFLLRTDSSGYCLGAVLMQGDGPDERPVEYASRLLTSAERNYTTTEREALAVVWAVNKYRGYIEGAEIIIKSDHQPLRWLMSIKSPSGRLARWALALQEFNLHIEYTPGRSNAIADTLSRPPCAEESGCDLCYTEVDLPSRSPSDIRENQLKDPTLRKIIEDLEVTNEPFRGRCWSDRGFVMSDGILYRYGPEADDEETACLVVPVHEREKILADYHDAPTAGHFGVERTLQRLSTKYYWSGMRQFVTEYIKKCVPCQRYKVDTRKPAGLLQTPATARRFEVIAVDLFGPLPETPNHNKWILIVEDTCTRWVELFALQDATSQECAKVLITEVFLRYNVPRRVLSDNGVQFISAVMQQVCSSFGITQSLTPRYHPEANPVERKNRDLKPQLAILVKQNHSEWDTHLAAIRFAMNSAVTSSTGYTPAYLTFGRELRAPADVLSDMRTIVERDNVVTSLTPYLRKLTTVLLDARDVHEKRQAFQKKNADEGRRPGPEYAIGDLVLLKTQGANDAGRGQTPKFIPRRDGPYRIKEIASPTTYILEKVSDTESIGRYHVSQLTPFIGEVQPPLKEKKRRGRPKKLAKQ